MNLGLLSCRAAAWQTVAAWQPTEHAYTRRPLTRSIATW